MSFFGTNNAAAKPFGGFGAASTAQPNSNPFGTSLATSTQATGGGFGTGFGAAQPGTTTAAGGSTTTGTGLFGSSNTTNNNNAASSATGTGTGLFGTNPNQQQQAGSGLFGTQPAVGAIGGGGLFGTQPAAGGAAGGGIFGAKPATTGGGLFGQTQSAAGTTGIGLFGTQPAAGGAAGGGGTGFFGSTQQTAGGTGTGFFGSTQQTAGPTGGGLFGTQPTAGGGLFGQQSNTTGNTGLLGQQGAKPGGLFGQPAAFTTGGGGLFGQPAGGAKPGGGMFGTSTAGGFGFGNSTTLGGFGATQNQQQQQQGSLNAQGQALLALLTKVQQLQQAIQGIVAQSPMGSSAPSGHQESLEMVGRLGGLLYSLTTEKFQHVFYNVVDPAQVAMYVRPSYVSDALWEKAVKENPDPRCMVPAFAMGMEDLQKRADAQAKAAESCKAKLDEIRTKLATLSQRHVLSTSLRSQKLSNNHILLFQRVVRLSQHLHLLIPLVRSSAIRPEEEQLRGRLEAIEDELRRGNASKGRMNEMWGVIGQLTALKAREGMETGGEGKEWAVVDEEGLRRLSRILTEQQHGLAHLTRILQDGLKDLAVIHNHLQPGGPLASSS